MSENFDVEDGCGTDESLAVSDGTAVARAALGLEAADAATSGEMNGGATDADGAAEREALPADETAGLLDAVRIEVRRGEIVITIRAEALEPAAVTRPRVETRRAGRVPTAGAREPMLESVTAGRAGRAPAFVGLGNVPADKYGDGYNYFRIRADLTDSYRAAYQQVKALGGVLTSSGGIRDLRERATAGRSRTSLHYTGRAIDLFIYTGMQGGAEPYLVTRDGGTNDSPLWHLYCVSTTPQVEDPLYDASLIEEGELECVRWQRGVGYKTYRRHARYFSLTDVLASHGWERIPARSDWRTQYLSCEWWHFQNPRGLVVGQSTFGDQLREVWAADLVRASGLALDAVWAGRSFRVGQPISRPAAPLSPAALDPAEKIYWAQVVLNATGGETLRTDGELGPRTTAALKRFQLRNGLQAGGMLDASTEVALLQRTLAHVAGESLPRIGVLDEATTTAVIRFQRARGLVADGRAGPKTRAAMVVALGAPAFAPAAADAAASAPGPAAAAGRPRRERSLVAEAASPPSPRRAPRSPGRADLESTGSADAAPRRRQRRGRTGASTAEVAEARR